MRVSLDNGMGALFICYRRDDSEDVTGRLYDRLVKRFGKRRVFKDVLSIAPGRDFVDAVKLALRGSDVALVLIGDQWQSERLQDPKDPVRIEIETALAANVEIIPIFVRRGKMPAHASVPPSLEAFTRRNGLPLRADPDFDRDYAQLISALPSKSASRGMLVALLAAVCAVLAIVASLVLHRSDTPREPGRLFGSGTGSAPAQPVVVPAGSVLGIDTASVDRTGRIDWDGLRGANVRFAILRMGYGTTLDTAFADSWRDAKAAGIIRGAYQFFRSDESPEEQATFFLTHVTLEPGDLAPVLDVETPNRSAIPTVDGIQTWLSIVEKATGRVPIIYTSRQAWSEARLPPSFGRYPLWAARYGVAEPKIPPGWRTWTFWQYVADITIPGAGRVDTNLFNGTYEQLKEFAQGQAQR